MVESVEFFPMSVKPEFKGEWCADVLLVSLCDGYHHKYAKFDPFTDKFMGFGDWESEKHEDDSHYIMWARLPEIMKVLG